MLIILQFSKISFFFFDNPPICRLPVGLDTHNQTTTSDGLINETVKTCDGPPQKTGSSITDPLWAFVHWRWRWRSSVKFPNKWLYFFFRFMHIYTYIAFWPKRETNSLRGFVINKQTFCPTSINQLRWHE